MKRNCLYIILFGIFYFSYISCTDQNITTSTKQATGTKDSLLGKKIVIPKGIEIFQNKENTLWLDSIQVKNYTGLKIVSYLNVSCPSCVGSIKEWDIILPDLKKYSIPVILICHTKDSFDYIKYLVESGDIKFPYPLFLDIKNSFLEDNPFYPKNILDHTILVDANNIVILSGNPRESNYIKNNYISEIEKHGSFK